MNDFDTSGYITPRDFQELRRFSAYADFIGYAFKNADFLTVTSYNSMIKRG